MYSTTPSHHTHSHQRRHRRRQRLSLLLKKTIAGFRCQKSNSEKFEVYLRRCVLHPIIGRSSLLRDFLSVQRTEDKIMPLRAIMEHVCKDRESLMITVEEDEKEQKLTIEDFDLIKVLGGGCTGKVLLVRRQAHRTNKLLALKAIPKPQVFLRSQIAHAKTERQILSVLSQNKHPFLVQLRYAFQDPSFLFLAFDFYAGGDLATQLKLHTRFPPERCRLYAAEMLLGIQELHRWGILDLKPENVLIGADGHLVLTDFGLSKWTDDNGTRRANTICGTPEYLAPEVVCGYEYGYEVDYWSYGTILYEMIDGFPPFWDEDSDMMYRQIVAAPLRFTSHRFDLAARDLLTGLLERDPAKRLGRDNAATRSHRYFMSLDWAAVYDKQYRPQYVP
ncbi:kinase-like domain-containing protein, partial [Dichotomocladium elegans]